ncbi:hypothetical protein EO087_10125 [Dyella sp. M7H15-1]|uniref:BP74-related protein n=1 Tax=Dyella sp. M7H15-1 TaxID=2501295 RepID=UPI0010050499|nr:hypothetical protein [Dyella sp. M7H15-1]QAU24304.1 hypothetical protein EO087_10125 [Dyella sp. M7H15-1]
MKAKKMLLVALASAIAATSFSGITQAQTRYFSFVTPNATNSASTAFGPHEFVVAVNNPVLADQIASIIEGNTWHGDPVHIEGKIVRGRVAYNEEYPFHLNPDSLKLFSNNIEHCSATAFEVEEHLDLVGVPGSGFLQKGIWCPWDSRFVREIRYPYPAQ